MAKPATEPIIELILRDVETTLRSISVNDPTTTYWNNVLYVKRMRAGYPNIEAYPTIVVWIVRLLMVMTAGPAGAAGAPTPPTPAGAVGAGADVAAAFGVATVSPATGPTTGKKPWARAVAGRSRAVNRSGAMERARAGLLRGFIAGTNGTRDGLRERGDGGVAAKMGPGLLWASYAPTPGATVGCP